MSALTPQQYAKKLHALARDELPGVFVRSINRVATAADGAQRRGLRREFTVRNRWSEGSLMLWRAKPSKQVDKINAIVGSRSEYLRLQEEGGVERNRDGSATMSLPSRKARRGNWGRAVSSSMRLSKIGPIAARGSGGRMAPRGAKAFILTPGKSADGLSKRRTSKAWRTWSRSKRSKPAPPKGAQYKLNKDVIFTRAGKGGRLVRVRVLNKSPTTLKATRWHSKSVAPVARVEVIGAAFSKEASDVLTRLGAT